MLDFVLGAFFVALVVRGWMKGFVREALDVLTLLLGAVLAFRFSGVIGSVISAMSGVSPEVGRLSGGVVAFLAISVAAAFASSLIHRTIRKLPAMTTLNRLAGAGLGGVYALVLATLALTLIAITPVPESVSAEVESSVLASRLTNPDGPVQRGVEALAGDRVMQTVISLRRLVGERVIAADGSIALPPADGKTQPSAEAARAVYEALNKERVSAGLDPLAWSDELAVVALTRADSAYRSGTLTPDAPDLATRLRRLGLPSSYQGENVALAATPAGVHEALTASDPHRAELLNVAYRKVGIGVVGGPYGLVTVEVFTG